MPLRKEPSRFLESVVALAKEAGRRILEIYVSDFRVGVKEDSSPLTAADLASHHCLVEGLTALRPAYPILSEESKSLPFEERLEWETFWLVDPLDGTKEFVARRGEFTVNVALVRDGRPVLGVVYAPASSVLFAGDVEQRTAFRSPQEPSRDVSSEREAIHVRPVPERGLTVVASRSHSNPETEAYLAALPVADRVSIGSSLKFCLVASGQADFYPRLGPTMEWDTAAGHAVLEAAGGMVLAPDGSPLGYGKPQFRNTAFLATGVYKPPSPAA